MIDVTRTTTQLLSRLHDAQDAEAWEHIDKRYRPLLENFARRLGLNDADAADVAQETLTRFVSEYRDGKYKREAGRLRSWLIGICRYRVLSQRRSQAVRKEYRGESAIINLDDDEALTQAWEGERRALILRQAMQELKNTRMAEKTIQAFELLVTQGKSAPEVAETLGMSTHDVYLAKNRCSTKLREIVERIDAAFEGE